MKEWLEIRRHTSIFSGFISPLWFRFLDLRLGKKSAPHIFLWLSLTPMSWGMSCSQKDHLASKMESTTPLHYFFLDHFKGNSLAVRLQQHYKEGKECDVIVSCPITKDRQQSKDVLEIRVHSQVVASWSKFLDHLIRKERVKKIISEEEPFTIYFLDTTPDMLRLITDMMYTGSAVVSSLLLKKFKRTVKMLKIKVIERKITATPERPCSLRVPEIPQ